jgi:hypothetical protein
MSFDIDLSCFVVWFGEPLAAFPLEVPLNERDSRAVVTPSRRLVQRAINLRDEFHAASERHHICAEFFLTAACWDSFSRSAAFAEKRNESFRARFIAVK